VIKERARRPERLRKRWKGEKKCAAAGDVGISPKRQPAQGKGGGRERSNRAAFSNPARKGRGEKTNLNKTVKGE